MRKIKFRIWHKIEKRWLDPWAEEDPTLTLKDYGLGCEVFLYDRKHKAHSNLNCQMENVVIQQYIGVNDKNMVEIYEGDIIRTPHGGYYPERIGRVVYLDDHFGFVFKFKDVIEDIDITNTKYEVLGNIFESSEEDFKVVDSSKIYVLN